jgi:hypothetical protein
MHAQYSLSLLLLCCSHFGHKASVKHFVSLQFLNRKATGRTPWTGNQPVVRPLPTQTQNKRRQSSMPWVGFELTIPAFERAKTGLALDSAATRPVLKACNRSRGENFAYLFSLRTGRSYKQLKDQLKVELSSRKSVVRLILIDEEGDGDLSQGLLGLSPT